MKFLLTALALSLCACGGSLSPKAQRAVDTFECLVAAVVPYVGDALDAEELVRDAISGRANLVQALKLLGSTPDDLRQINDAMGACLAGPELQSEPAEYRLTAQ